MPRPLRGKTTQPILQAARDLRHHLTQVEEILWQALRSGQLAGLKFRRQHPLGPYVLDFYCVQVFLAVELDGAVHLRSDQAEHDALRDEFLLSQGIRVLRIQNEAVEQNLDAVLRQIFGGCQAITSPSRVIGADRSYFQG